MTSTRLGSVCWGFLIALALLYASTTVHIHGLGGDFNRGAYIRVAGHFCGIEWNGSVGTFCDVDY